MQNLVVEFLSKAKSHYWSRRFHLEHKKEALKQLKSIEEQKGKTDPRFIKLSDEYAKDVLGFGGFAPWLYVYSAVSESFKEGWLPDNYYGAVVVPKISGEYGEVCDLRSLSHMIFNSVLFPEICFRVNGFFYTRDNKSVDDANLKEKLFEKSRAVVFKTDNSLQGTGVHVLNYDNFDVNKIKLLGNGIFQEYIRQHDVFNRMTSNSVATLRITTALDGDGDCSVRACYLRVGRENDTHVMSKSNIRIPIGLETGEFGEKGYLPNWHEIERHPDTNECFSGSQVPAYDDCLKTVLALHRNFPFVRCIGWDICVDENSEIKIMEWNGGHNDVKFTEATQGPCFSHFNWERLP